MQTTIIDNTGKKSTKNIEFDFFSEIDIYEISEISDTYQSSFDKSDTQLTTIKSGDF